MRFGTWEKGEFKGRGGQGDVYLARKVVLDPLGWAERLKNTVAGLNGIANVERNLQRAADFRELLHEAALQRDAPMGALKIMHRITDPDVAAKARGRMKQELAALAGLDHPAIVKILDSRPEEGWFVMEYFSSGTLETRLGDAAGDTRRALAAFRPLVEATARIHTKGYIHRDIKPANIFVGDAGKLVLGDFGLVIDPLSNEPRQTDTYENVGSRDWMPAWAYGMRIDDVKPTFDVFSLGKILWSMISGQKMLRLWYHDHPQFNLEQKFSNDPTMRLVNALFRKCITEHEKDCTIRDAGQMLEEIDVILDALRRGAQVPTFMLPMKCIFCGLGTYFRSDAGNDLLFSCSNCGNMQKFLSYEQRPAWQ